MHSKDEKIAQLEREILELKNQRGATTVRQSRLDFMDWLLRARNLDSQDYNALTDNGRRVLQNEFATVQATEAHRTEERQRQAERKVVLPPDGASWPPEKRIAFANLCAADASEAEFSARGFEKPKRG